MRVIFVTAHLPHGTDEAFLVPEIEEFMRGGHQALVVPRSPQGPVIHGGGLVQHTRRESLYSARVLSKAAVVALAAPIRTLRATASLFRSRTAAVAIKNLAVMPKALWLAGVAREWGADHIHSHWAGTTATLAMLASKISGIPWSFTAHRWDVVENNLLADKVKAAAFARFISEDGLLMARAIGIGPAPNARVLFMGVTLPPAIQMSRGSGAGGDSKSRRPIVVCPARLVEIKGHRFLIEAWRILRDRGIDGELWLAGGGELRTALESYVRSLGLHDSIRFLGTLPHEELLRIYDEAPITAVALASDDLGNGLHEGIPVALMEAMSYGIPVVATNAGGTPELVKSGTGFLVPPRDATALADALHRLFEDPALAAQLGHAARRHVMENHDIAGVASQLARALEAGAALPRISAAV